MEMHWEQDNTFVNDRKRVMDMQQWYNNVFLNAGKRTKDM